MTRLLPLPPGVGSRSSSSPRELPEPEITTPPVVLTPAQPAHPDPTRIPPRHSDGRIARRGEAIRNPVQVAAKRRRRFQESLRKMLTDAGGVDLLAAQIAAAVMDGDPAAIKLATEHLYGKPAQQVDVTTQGESLNDRPTQVVHFGDLVVEFK